MQNSLETEPGHAADLTLEQLASGDFCVRLTGNWQLGGTRGLFDKLEAALASVKTGRKVVFDASALGKRDSSLLVLLFRLHDFCKSRRCELDASGLPEDVRRLLQMATLVPARTEAAGPRRSPPLLRRLGEGTLELYQEFRSLLAFTGESMLSLLRLGRGEARMRGRDFWKVLQDVGAQALPIVALISFLVGLIIAFLGAVVLQRFGAEFAVAYLVGYGMLREMGAVMAGVIMAGRTGAAFAAEIGSMKVTEELDALKTMGISPMDFIVLPRLLALALMMPLLTVYADIIGIIGGYFVSNALLEIPSTQFFRNLNQVSGIADLLLGVFKGGVFGVLVAVSGCLRGIQCGNSADAVGVAATRAVVTGITLIIFANALIDWVAAVLGI